VYTHGYEAIEIIRKNGLSFPVLRGYGRNWNCP
jgi:hypothetical protein